MTTAPALQRALLLIQGIYFFITGLWPILHMPSFLWITGPKTDLWLVQTVGALLALIGLVLIVAGNRRVPTTEALTLAIGSALTLAGVDVTFVLYDVISPIYLLDAFAELLFVLFYGVSFMLRPAPGTADDTVTPTHAGHPFPRTRPL